MGSETEPFGEETIEGAVMDDVGYAFESESATVTVRVANESGDQEEHEIEFCNIELDREKVPSHHSEMEYYEVIYALTVPAELDVDNGDSVIVSGFESSWEFTFVTVDEVEENLSTVFTEYIQPLGPIDEQ